MTSVFIGFWKGTDHILKDIKKEDPNESNINKLFGPNEEILDKAVVDT